ncbi:MAG TPA: hypothetical protein VM076_23585 [Gemmatimonadaceae bacterium]|nr:hypothetical protein [Gemmatimonadaceae bacterium]
MRSSSLHAAIGVLSIVASGYTLDAPTAVPTGQPHTVASPSGGQSGCQSVAFTSAISGTFPLFTGTMAGDLEGTLQVLQDPSSIVAPNDIYARVDGTIDFRVTGGSVPDLIGRSFRTSSISSNRFAPDSDPTLGEIGGRVRAVDGVSKANLTFHGFVDVTDGTPPFEVHLSWHGVICP